MQILESSGLGLRAARHRLINEELHLSVTIFPMVHIGESEFYQTVYKQAFDHDVVLVEGVRSPVVSLITTSYPWIEKSKLGLIIQPSYPEQKDAKANIVHADLTAEEFHAEWRKVPLWLRLAAFVISPMVGLERRYLATRSSLAKNMGLEDLQSRDEVLSWDPSVVAFKRCILGARDKRLIECLNQVIEHNNSKRCSIAIVYGARHMRAVLNQLKRKNFISSESEWQTVFYL